MKRLTGKVAWVTGAGSGIGEAGALALAEEGASVMLTGRRKEPLDAVAARIAKDGGTARVHQGDMARSDDASRIAAAIEKEFAIRFRTAELQSLRNVGNFVEIIRAKLQGRS